MRQILSLMTWKMSALNEIGNIVSGSYLTAISKLTNLKMVSTVPEMTIDMIGALLSSSFRIW